MKASSSESTAILQGECYHLDGEYLIHKHFEKLIKDPLVRERQALFFNGSTLSFGELENKANSLARELARKLNNHQDNSQSTTDKIIAICLKPSIELIVSLLSVFKVGAAYLPLDPSFPANRVNHILNDATPKILLTSNSILQLPALIDVAGNQASIIFDIERWQCEESTSDDYSLENEAEPDNGILAAVLYTSGSTGIPKGVRLLHDNIYQRIYWQWKTFPFTDEEVGCFKTALTFVDSIAEIWAPLLIGVPLHIIPKNITQNAELFVDLLDQYKVSRLVLVPSLLQAMLAYAKSRKKHCKNILAHLKLWVCSGEVLPEYLLLQFFDCFRSGKTICNFYGSTEVMGDVTYSIFNSQENASKQIVHNKVPIGQPLDNCTVYLLNDSRQPVEIGEIGEIYVAGSHIAAGYVNGKEMDRFIANTVESKKGYETMYRTGDYGRIINSSLFYEGRSDSQIKIRGHRVDLMEVNKIINQFQEVSDSVVLCHKAGEPDQEMVAFVMLRETDTMQAVKKRLKDQLLPYMIPQIMEMQKFPLLVNGKIDRQQLLRDFVDCQQYRKSVVLANANQLSVEERDLLTTVVSIVGNSAEKSIQLSDNFFNIGGNSLNAVSVVTKLRDQGYNMSIGTFLSAETLSDVACKLRQKCEFFLDDKDSGYLVEMLSSSTKEDVIKIICKSFSEKGELEHLTKTIYQDYEDFMNELWDPLVTANLSFAVKSKENQVLAVALNFDVFDEPVVLPKSQRIGYIFEFLESLEAPIRETYFEKRTNNLIHSFMMGTDDSLSAADNVVMIQIMEQETIKLAKERGFAGVFTTNTNELTRQICDDVLNYQVLSEFQVKNYVATDGTRPFAEAPDTQYSVVTVKYIDG